MKIGFFTPILRRYPLEKLFEWASTHGFTAVEVFTSPGSPHIDAARDLGRAGEIKKMAEEHNLEITLLGYYVNNLDPNLDARRAKNEYLKKCIDMAYRLEVGLVGTFAGSPENFKTLKIEDAVKEFRKVFGELVSYAEEHGVRIALENCPMGGWNIAYSPVTWGMLFNAVPSKHLGLNLDPSHLVWQFIDYSAAVEEYRDKIFHVHAKDTEILYGRLGRSGIYGRGWWRYRIPGWGEIDWRIFITSLLEAGYNYVLSIEHEDPVFEGEEGLLMAKKYLEDILGL